MISFGLIIGVYTAVPTVMNQMIIGEKFPNDVHVAGIVSFIMIIAGLFSVPLVGKILDTTGHCKAAGVIIDLCSVISMVGFTALTKLKIIRLLYSNKIHF